MAGKKEIHSRFLRFGKPFWLMVHQEDRQLMIQGRQKLSGGKPGYVLLFCHIRVPSAAQIEGFIDQTNFVLQKRDIRVS